MVIANLNPAQRLGFPLHVEKNGRRYLPYCIYYVDPDTHKGIGMILPNPSRISVDQIYQMIEDIESHPERFQRVFYKNPASLDPRKWLIEDNGPLAHEYLRDWYLVGLENRLGVN